MLVHPHTFAGVVANSFFLLLARDYNQLDSAAVHKIRPKETAILEQVPAILASAWAHHQVKTLAQTVPTGYRAALAASQHDEKHALQNLNNICIAGLDYADKGNFVGAELVIREAMRRFPNATCLYKRLAETLMNLTRFDEAERVLLQAQAIDPHANQMSVTLARLYYMIGDNDKLGAAASKAIETDPENYLACYLYSYWLIERDGGNIDGLRYLEKSIKLRPTFVEGLKAWGRLLSHQGRWKEAARTYNRALAVNPQDRGLYYLLSVAYRKLGNHEKADQALSSYQQLAKP